MTDNHDTQADPLNEPFERLLWDATREYMHELHAVDHAKTRALFRAHAGKKRTLIMHTMRISKRPATATTPSATAPSATTPSATTPSATAPRPTPQTHAEKQLKFMTRRAWEEQNAPKLDIIMRIVTVSARKDNQ